MAGVPVADSVVMAGVARMGCWVTGCTWTGRRISATFHHQEIFLSR
jgi:hypothetical protein